MFIVRFSSIRKTCEPLRLRRLTKLCGRWFRWNSDNRSKLSENAGQTEVCGKETGRDKVKIRIDREICKEKVRKGRLN